MILTPDDIKAITTEIASQIIEELKKPVERSFNEIEFARVCKTTYNGKDAPIDYFKDHEQHTHREIQNESTNE